MDQLSQDLFWDTDPTTLDPERHASYCIIRIVERGTRQEVRAAWSYYGEDRVREVLLKAPALSAQTITFFANQFNLPPKTFRAFRRSQNWNT